MYLSLYSEMSTEGLANMLLEYKKRGLINYQPQGNGLLLYDNSVCDGKIHNLKEWRREGKEFRKFLHENNLEYYEYKQGGEYKFSVRCPLGEEAEATDLIKKYLVEASELKRLAGLA